MQSLKSALKWYYMYLAKSAVPLETAWGRFFDLQGQNKAEEERWPPGKMSDFIFISIWKALGISGISKHVGYGGTRVKKYWWFIELFVWVPISVFQLKICMWKCVWERAHAQPNFWFCYVMLCPCVSHFTMIYLFLNILCNKKDMNQFVTKDLGVRKSKCTGTFQTFCFSNGTKVLQHDFFTERNFFFFF